MNNQLPIEIRPAYNIEHNFIYNSWIKSGFRSRALGIIAKELYTLNQHDVITHLLGRCNVLVAQELNKPESLYGYIVYQWLDGVFVLHYAYTKEMFRKLGVLSNLLNAANFHPQQSAGFYTHTTKAAFEVEPKLNLIYNPYLLINPKYEVLVSSPKTPVKPTPIKEINEFEIVGFDSQEQPSVIIKSSEIIEKSEEEKMDELEKELMRKHGGASE
jgi:hypothetical protein